MMIRMITQILSMVSAKLKIGKLNIPMLMKSLTPPYTSLSMRFPAVPAINNVVTTNPILFFTNNRINAPIPSMLTHKIRINGKGNDREIPVFNTGRINIESCIYFRV